MELLAPAGNLHKMKTAFAFGADAVYLGIPDFSLRTRINGFTIPSIRQAVKYAHKLDKKVYVTINIFAHNKHLKNLPKYIKKLKEIKVDALIVSDPGIIMEIKKYWPTAILHLSTQANCINWQSAKFWHENGVQRIVLGREVALDAIQEIHKKNPKLELEYFVHGAMCMSYSGRCDLSKYFVDKSANLGDCVQPCRWNYNLTLQAENHEDKILELKNDQHGSYILNSKDLCLLKYLEQMKKAGVTSFKIEGRTKSAYYVANIVGIYKKILNKINQKNKIVNKEVDSLYNELEEKIVNRGYTTGFLLNKEAEQNTSNSHKKPKWEFCGQVVKCVLKNKEYLVYIKVHNSLSVGDEVEIVKPIYDLVNFKLKKMMNDKNGKELLIAHGGGSQHVVIIKSEKEIPSYSVVRRRIV